MVHRPSAKMALKFYGPYKILSRIGVATYRLQLPADSKIHNVFRVSQLKPFTANYSPVFSDLPSMVDLASGDFYPSAILERQMVKKGNAAVPQIKVRWSSLPKNCATWEDYHVLQARFPAASIWTGVPAQEGDSVVSSATSTDIEIDTE